MKISMHKQSFADKIGIFFSSLCAIHCLILPILIINSGSLLAKYIDNQWVEKGFIITCLAIAAFSFIKYKKQHGNKTPIILFVIAAIFLMLSMVSSNYIFEITLSIIGSTVLICGHIINMRSCKFC